MSASRRKDLGETRARGSYGRRMTRPAQVMCLCFLFGCTHVRPDDMSETDHRSAAAREVRSAAEDAQQYDPKAVATEPLVGSQTAEDPGPAGDTYYNPTADHLMRAQAHLRLAHAHTAAADQLERFEDVACAKESAEQRAGCPLVTPSVERVQEAALTVRLHLKRGVDGAALVARMRCHQAFARTLAFAELPSCPLYARGLTLRLVDSGSVIELRAENGETAAQLRAQARALFGP